jgi:hypothetical protein
LKKINFGEHIVNIEEARKVLWLKSNPRPIGELLNEGYLNQSRLEWASEKAYDPALKEAAKLLLNWQKNSASQAVSDKKTALPSGIQLPSGASLDQAHATSWPFSPFKGQPMGMLVETKQVSIKDLGFAIENAWDERVRKAAMVLMLVRLDQVIKEPEEPAGFLNVVSGGKSYAEYKQDQLTLIQGILFGVFLTLSIVGAATAFIKQPSNQTGKSLSDVLASPSGIIGLIIVIIFFAGLIWLTSFLTDKTMNRIEKQKENYRRGEEGENRIVESMGQVLDGNWSLFRNIILPGRKKTDLDAVLVGPSGVWVLEVKTFSGTYRNIGEQWEYRIGNKWKLYGKSPSRQAKNNAVRLSEFFKADNISQWVTPAVIWANQESPLTIENPAVAVWQYNRLPDELGNIWHGEKLSETERNKIADKLSKLCEQQKKQV